MALSSFSAASVALPRKPLIAEDAVEITSSVGTDMRLRPSRTKTVPQQSTPAKALTMIRVRRLWRSTNVPPNTLHTCWATIEADPIHPAVTVEPEMW